MRRARQQNMRAAMRINRAGEGVRAITLRSDKRLIIFYIYLTLARALTFYYAEKAAAAAGAQRKCRLRARCGFWYRWRRRRFL